MNFLQFSFLTLISVFVFICFIMCFVALGKVHKLSKNLSEDSDTINEIHEYYEEIKQCRNSQQTNSVQAVRIPEAMFCKMSVVHFNAFPDVTGAISFCMALLNKENTGIILTSIYSHDSSNTYIRDVNNGKCDIKLLNEEQKALENAISQEVI